MNARMDAQHAHSTPALAPARSTPIPLVPRSRTAAATGMKGAAGAGATMTREVMGFAPYWALSEQASFQYGLMTTVDYFGLTVNGDGSWVQGSDGGWNGWNSQDLVSLINAAHQSGDRVVLTIKQFDEAQIYSIVTNPTYTQTAIQNAISAAASKNLDGINVDFEGYAGSAHPGIQQGMTNFMHQLTTQAHQWRSNSMVSIDTYSGSASWNGGIFNIQALAPNVDDFFVMAYDMWSGNEPGGSTRYALPNAPLYGWTYNDTTTVSQYTSQAPAGKVILGVPYYGVKWSTVSNQLNAQAQPNTTFQNPSYADTQSDLQCAQQHNLGLSYGWDPQGYSYYAAWWSPAANDPCGGNYNSWREVYFDDPKSLGYKYDLVNQSGIRGAGMWALGDDFGYNDLWNEIAAKFTVAPQWNRLGGVLTGSPAVSSWSSTREDVFAPSSDGQLWHGWFDGHTFYAWDQVPGGYVAPGTGPGAVSWGPGRIDFFVKGLDGALWHDAWSGGWQGWQSLGGQITSSPKVSSRGPGLLDVFARGPDGAVWHRYWDGAQWNGWDSVGGQAVGAPATASWGQDHVDVFVRGTDNALWHRFWYGSGWSAWESLGGNLTSAPDASTWGPGRVDVVAFAPGQNLWHMYWNGQWSSWLNDGGVSYSGSDPALVDWGPNGISSYIRGQDSALWGSTIPP